MNDSSHNFVFQDEDARCIECDCRPGGTAASKPCASLTDNVACSHNSIARCEQTIPWCTDCRQYIDQHTGGIYMHRSHTLARDAKPYFAKSKYSDREVVELRYDDDCDRYL